MIYCWAVPCLKSYLNGKHYVSQGPLKQVSRPLYVGRKPLKVKGHHSVLRSVYIFLLIFRINHKEFKHKFKFANLPAEETWKVNIIKELTDLKHSVYVLTNDGEEASDEPPIEFNQEELDEILDYVCTM